MSQLQILYSLFNKFCNTMLIEDLGRKFIKILIACGENLILWSGLSNLKMKNYSKFKKSFEAKKRAKDFHKKTKNFNNLLFIQKQTCSAKVNSFYLLFYF